MRGVNGRVTLKRFRLRGLRVGKLKLGSLDFVQRDIYGLSGPSGHLACVIGQPFLTQYAAEFDGIEQRFRLWPSNAVNVWAAKSAARSTTFERILGASPLHDGAWGQTRIRWVLDTGAAMTTINKAARTAMGLDGRQPLEIIERRGLDGRVARQPVIRIPPTEIYAGLRKQTLVEVGELPVLAALGIGRRRAAGIVGADIIQGQRLLVDFAGARVWVTGPVGPG